ncbi:MAG: glycosyltransferase [Nitrospinota bacterium]
MLSPIAWRTPPRHYGPWERTVSLLTDGLVKKGIDVTLFATGESETKAKLVSVVAQGYEEDRELSPKVWECLHISQLFERADEFDIIHNQFDFLPLTYTAMTKTPVVTTIHGFSSPKILPVYRKYNDSVYYVAISDADRSPDLSYIATVRHGIDIESFTFNPVPGEYILFFGRFHWDKGAKEAIEIAKKTGRRLILAGIIQDEAYFNREVKPHIDDKQIVYAGTAGPEKRDELLGNALALLHPINFEEPFGLSVVESMACGTPVIAFNKGSMPELIIEGKTGFLVRNVDEAAEAVSRIKSIGRKECRTRVEERFTADRMADDYIKVYQKILDQRENYRPWGFYDVLSDEPDHKLKRITVYPGKRLSLQRHRRRSEHWYVVEGSAVVTLDDREIALEAGGAVDIPKGAAHRIKNTGADNMVFVEVQRGDYFGEDDIERLEDDYGRK